MAKSFAERRQRVCDANKLYPGPGFVKFTWGNVAEDDRESGLIVVIPSGVDYDNLTPENIVVTYHDGNFVEGDLNPSSDNPTHVALCRAGPEIGGIVHTHSTEAFRRAQSGRDMPFSGTTPADYFYGPVPCVRSLTADELNSAHDSETGTDNIE